MWFEVLMIIGLVLAGIVLIQDLGDDVAALTARKREGEE